jgi:hypothetical protein
MNLSQAIASIAAHPDVTFLVTSAPGQGKTQGICAELAKRYHVVLADTQNMPAEDMAQLPVVKGSTTTFASNVFWKPHDAKPTAYVLDELGKAQPDVQNALIPLISGKPRRVQGYTLRPNDIVCVLSNDGTLALGDKFKSHHYNRMVQIHVEPPTVAEALPIMTMLGFDARIVEWVSRTPSALCSFDATAQSKNAAENQTYFGLYTAKPAQAYCSMRSLEEASKLLKDSSDAVLTNELLQGCIGKPAALSLSHFLKDIGEFVDPRRMEADPMTCPVPKSLFDQRLAMLGLASHIGKLNYKPMLQYLARYPKDLQFVALTTAAKRADHMELITVPAIAKLLVEHL